MNHPNHPRHADKVYNFLSNNAIPLQVNHLQPSHASTLNPHSYLSPRTYSNYYNLKSHKTPSPSPVYQLSRSPSNISLNKPELKVINQPALQQKLKTISRLVQATVPQIDQSSQISQPSLQNTATQTEEIVKTQYPPTLCPQDPKTPSIRFSEVLKLKRQQESQRLPDQGPRQVTSYINQAEDESHLVMSRNSIDYLDFQMLMQVVFLKDAYTFQELSDLQEEDEDAKAFISNVSRQLEQGMGELDPTDLSQQEEIAQKAKSKLQMFEKVIQKAIKALEGGEERRERNTESFQSEKMKFTGSFPVTELKHFQTFEQRGQLSMGTEDLEREQALKKKYLQSDLVDDSD